ncbi:GNAT family N-acetyltransferase [Rubritalea tangerina]|uniref:GNAT family N-acetyltransferase n=2 Tax=Rubritalea tangerina TaxID=430798 RepID=A0ABW4Z8W5_9BACT
MNTPINTLTTPNLPQSILVLCPHPDDFDVAGVTLHHFHSRACPIHVAIAPTSSGVLDSFFPSSPTPEQCIHTREAEQAASLDFFGLTENQRTFFPHSMDLDANGEMTHSPTNLLLIEEILLKSSPDTVFLPHPNDNNPAHEAMYAMLSEIIVKHQLDLTLYLQMDPKTHSLQIDAFTPIDENMSQWKTQLLTHHQTQDHRNQQSRGISLAQRILSKNQEAASQLALASPAAEAFELRSSRSLRFPISPATELTPEITEAFHRLTPQLADIPVPNDAQLTTVIHSEASTLFLMHDASNNAIIGTATLATYPIPTDNRTWIEDVIIDHTYRGKGLGQHLINHLHNFARQSGIHTINLTSTPSRLPANKLYQSLGYAQRNTNAYRISL